MKHRSGLSAHFPLHTELQAVRLEQLGILAHHDEGKEWPRMKENTQKTEEPRDGGGEGFLRLSEPLDPAGPEDVFSQAFHLWELINPIFY